MLYICLSFYKLRTIAWLDFVHLYALIVHMETLLYYLLIIYHEYCFSISFVCLCGYLIFSFINYISFNLNMTTYRSRCINKNIRYIITSINMKR